ncbi:glycoprotein-N-acetylgalactosamine 3-beta-galactosyltransferase 1-like [Haliotis cracherodii]|uniref:glycoprotein-N-acetylgalactosamine 3-beta-galactosyltransferase 1-like n=1 Tax=Haliotis cracherodii TaxID=6455 RepID=UPI0039EBDCC2
MAIPLRSSRIFGRRRSAERSPFGVACSICVQDDFNLSGCVGVTKSKWRQEHRNTHTCSVKGTQCITGALSHVSDTPTLVSGSLNLLIETPLMILTSNPRPRLKIRQQDVPGRMYRGYCFLVLGCLFMLQFILWMGATYTDTRSQAVESSPTRVDTVMRDTLDSSVLIDDSVAMDTLSKLKIFCWITTKETEVNKKIPAVNETWAKRCDHRMFVMTTNKPNTGMDILNLNIKDGRQHLTDKSIASLKHIYKHHLDKYDWFLKADDDTFVVMENLKFLLSHYDPTEGVYVGHLFKKYTKWGYMSGGAGYVISISSTTSCGTRVQ